jgi:hypothetical protein
MQTVSGAGLETPYRGGEMRSTANESAVSAVSWAAVFGGAVVALSITLVLIALASGLGLASLSPWSGRNPSATTFTVTTAIGLIVVQWISSGLGGYITGRLRTKWVGVHTHEVFFRDTANGFLTWALATVVGTILLASAASSVVGGTVNAAATVASGAAAGAGQAAVQSGNSGSVVSGYDVDSLFRSDTPASDANSPAAASEASRILAAGMRTGDIPPADRTYLAKLVAARTGISQADAEKRVDDVITRVKAAEAKARQAADTARKAASAFSIATALSMLIGAFIACAAAAYGGSLRDEY